MAWFEYGTPKRRSLRKGVALRVRHLPEPIVKEANKLKRAGEFIDMVFVEEILPKGRVLLQFWCRRHGSKEIKFGRYTVFAFDVPEDPKWVCESDLGRGYKPDKDDPPDAVHALPP